MVREKGKNLDQEVRKKSKGRRHPSTGGGEKEAAGVLGESEKDSSKQECGTKASMAAIDQALGTSQGEKFFDLFTRTKAFPTTPSDYTFSQNAWWNVRDDEKAPKPSIVDMSLIIERQHQWRQVVEDMLDMIEDIEKRLAGDKSCDAKEVQRQIKDFCIKLLTETNSSDEFVHLKINDILKLCLDSKEFPELEELAIELAKAVEMSGRVMEMDVEKGKWPLLVDLNVYREMAQDLYKRLRKIGSPEAQKVIEGLVSVYPEKSR